MGQDVGLLRLVHLALGHQLIQALVQTALGSLDDIVVDVADHYIKALLGKNLRDVQAHGAAADDNNLFHVLFLLLCMCMERVRDSFPAVLTDS